jgi:hypothetical protein
MDRAGVVQQLNCNSLAVYIVALVCVLIASAGQQRLSLVITTSSSNTEDKVDNNSSQQSNSQDGRTKAVVETALTSHTDALCSPVEGDECVDHSGHGDQGEQTSRDLADLVTEVEETDCETAQDDGEVEPTEESTLVGEEDLGLDTSGQGDALACEQIRVSI